MSEKRASGALFGLAYGDALGKPTEFLNHQQAVRVVEALAGDLPTPALVTDDTQMALAVAEAVAAGAPDYRPKRMADLLTAAFVGWYKSPLNNRAPGAACMAACQKLSRGVPWARASGVGKRGCGTVMRVAPVGLAGMETGTMTGLAQMQAGMTHGDPGAVCAAALWAQAVHLTAHDTPPQRLVDALWGYMKQESKTAKRACRYAWHGELWYLNGDTAWGYIKTGWDACGGILSTLQKALDGPTLDDPADACGEGWIATEAVGTALYAYLTRGEPVETITYAAASRGDSDSLASMAGTLAGAYNGLHAWPQEWQHRIENDELLARFGSLWD